jgi:hypothetical protein
VLEAGGPNDSPAIHDPARFHELWLAAEDGAATQSAERTSDAARSPERTAPSM